MSHQDMNAPVIASGSLVMDEHWAGCRWTSWTPLFDRDSIRSMPSGPGLYRIAVKGSSLLAYIGQTGRSLRERVTRLALQGLADSMPFNDPHTAAPGIWCYRRVDGHDFLASVAVTSDNGSERQAR